MQLLLSFCYSQIIIRPHQLAHSFALESELFTYNYVNIIGMQIQVSTTY